MIIEILELFGIGAIIVVFVKYILEQERQRNNRKLEQDRKRLFVFQNILPNNSIRNFTDDVFNGYYHRDFLVNLDEYSKLYKESIAIFFNKKLEEARTEFNYAFNKLLKFLVVHFFVHFSDKDIYALYPELKYSLNKEKRNLYDRRFKELRKILDDFEDKYNNFLKTAKERIVL